MRQRVLMVVGSALVTTALLAAPASATPPTRETSHGEFDDDLGDGICGFPLLAHVEQTVTVTTFYDGNGNPTRRLVTGPIFVTFTNRDTGESARRAIPGPTFQDAEGEAIRGTGSWITVTPDGDLVWAAGNIVFDEDGVATEISGTSVSVCDLL